MSAWPLRFLLAAGALLAPAAVSNAQPQIPSSFFGSVTIDGNAAPDGTEVRALVDGVDCSQSPPGERTAAREGEATVYVIHVVHESQRPGCGRDGKVITFTIAGRPALQQGTWKPGPQQLDLSTGTGDIVPLPTSTPTVPGANPDTPLATGTGTPPGSRPTGTPPTDDVQLPGTLTPPAGATGTPKAPASPNGDGGGGSVWGLLVAAVGVIAAGGAAAGVVLARRRKSAAP